MRVVEPARGPLHGALRPASDKSISHRALMLGAIAEGETTIRGLLDGDDVRSTWRCLEACGASIERQGERVVVRGGDLRAPAGPLDCGNSGTTLRLLSGLLAGYPLEATLVGDASLSRRPMQRVAEPLRRMGARLDLAPGGTAPLRLRGGDLRGIDLEPAVASAQVKSAVLLAGLRARGATRVSDADATRTHTEDMLRRMGVELERRDRWLSLVGGQRPRGCALGVPADPSAAAFLLAAAALVPGSAIACFDVCTDRQRMGFYEGATALGARVGIGYGPPPGDDVVAAVDALVASHSPAMRACALAAPTVVRGIDEVPILAVLAAFATGVTTIRDAAELRHKESDRLALVARNLRALGVLVVEVEDGLDITGDPARALRGGVTIETQADHRIAMAFAVAALRADGPVTIDDDACVAVSYPDFWTDLERLRS